MLYIIKCLLCCEGDHTSLVIFLCVSLCPHGFQGSSESYDNSIIAKHGEDLFTLKHTCVNNYIMHAIKYL